MEGSEAGKRQLARWTPPPPGWMGATRGQQGPGPSRASRNRFRCSATATAEGGGVAIAGAAEGEAGGGGAEGAGGGRPRSQGCLGRLGGGAPTRLKGLSLGLGLSF